MKAIYDDMRKRTDEAFRDVGNDPKKLAGFKKKAAALEKEALAKMTAKLTRAQRQTWKDLAGEPFELKQENFPPPARDGGKKGDGNRSDK
jgi:hypothetical protein